MALRRATVPGSKDVVSAASVALIISLLSYFLTDGLVRIWLPGIGAYGSAIVHGFPVPYYAYFPTNLASQLYYPLNFAGDFVTWFTVSLLVVSAFTVRRLILACVCGAAVTASTLLIPPLALAAPEVGNMEASGTSMGFPFEYLIRVFGGFGLTSNINAVTWTFSLVRAAADYLLWSGVVFAVIGSIVLLTSRTKKPPDATPGNATLDAKSTDLGT